MALPCILFSTLSSDNFFPFEIRSHSAACLDSYPPPASSLSTLPFLTHRLYFNEGLYKSHKENVCSCWLVWSHQWVSWPSPPSLSGHSQWGQSLPLEALDLSLLRWITSQDGTELRMVSEWAGAPPFPNLPFIQYSSKMSGKNRFEPFLCYF